MSAFSRIVVLFGGLGFVGFGLWIIFDPIQAFQAMNLVMPDEASIRIELRSFYGGLEVGLGLFLLACAVNTKHTRTGLLLAVATFGAIGTVRLIAILTEGYFSSIFWIALGVELGLAILAGIALLVEKDS